MKVLKGRTKHSTGVVIFPVSAWKHSDTKSLLVQANAPSLLAQTPMFPIVISLVLCVRCSECMHLCR